VASRPAGPLAEAAGHPRWARVRRARRRATGGLRRRRGPV